jgi:DpnII restriction endonuclease
LATNPPTQGRAVAKQAAESGRKLEDQVEHVIKGVGLTFVSRKSFTAKGGLGVSSDFCIPNRDNAVIVVAVKTFGSTGSKLTAAYDELNRMATSRRTSQYIFGIVDGVGWYRRAPDLRKIYKLWADDDIEGVYTESTLDRFRDALVDAAVRSRLIDP